MEKKFTKPEIEVIVFEEDDIIVASIGNGGDEGEEGGNPINWPWG